MNCSLNCALGAATGNHVLNRSNLAPLNDSSERGTKNGIYKRALGFSPGTEEIMVSSFYNCHINFRRAIDSRSRFSCSTVHIHDILGVSVCIY